ncbi:MAG: hypothetical protein H6739_06495 [Alphaproteobacteria bacterium]|nr:hypothetical protein [Alphaproteobacteria bacterium]
MADFMLLFRGGNPRDRELSPEQFQQHMADWGAWIQGLHARGVFRAGESLKPDGGRVLDARLVVTDGPFVEAKELVGGFVILNAKDIEEATALARGCPVLKTGGAVEIREILET